MCLWVGVTGARTRARYRVERVGWVEGGARAKEKMCPSPNKISVCGPFNKRLKRSDA